MTPRPFTFAVAFLLPVAAGVVTGCTRDAAEDDAVASSEEALTQAELVTQLTGEGFRADGRELHKVEILRSERSEASGMVCVLNNAQWAFGRICYFVYRTVNETRTLETWAERFVHADGRVAYAIEGYRIGPFKLGTYPVWGRWASQTEGGSAPAQGYSCDEWSSFQVELRDFRADRGFSVKAMVDGGRFPDPFPSTIESQFFGVEHWLTADASGTKLEAKKTFEDGLEKGELGLMASTKGGLALRLTKTRKRAPDQVAPWDARSYVFAGGGGPNDCPLVTCGEGGASVDLEPTGFQALRGRAVAKRTCGPVRTRSGYPAYFLPKSEGATCSADEGIIVYAYGGTWWEPPKDEYGWNRSVFGVTPFDRNASPQLGASTNLTLTTYEPERNDFRAPLPDGKSEEAYLFEKRDYKVLSSRRGQRPDDYWRDLLVAADDAVVHQGVPLAMKLGTRYCAEYYDSGTGGTNYAYHSRRACTYPDRDKPSDGVIYGDPGYFASPRARLTSPTCAPVRVE